MAKRLSFAGCNFSRNLISGGGFDKVYSTMPLFVSGGLNVKYDGIELIYSPLRKFGKRASRLATFAEQLKVFLKISNCSELWLYNLGILNVLLYILLRMFKTDVKIFVIVLDFTPPNKKFSLNYFYLKLINKADGVIKLADSSLFVNPNSVCMAGVVPNVVKMFPRIVKPQMQFLLSGVLQPDISSIPIILEAFAQCPQCVLHITGEWSNVDMMNCYTKGHDNIIYHGVLAYEDYLELLCNVTFSLSLRNPDWKDNKCNFPSKIIEALLYNRIVISTIDYLQIHGIKYIKTERSIGAFVDMLRHLSSMSESELLSYANQGIEVAERFSASEWNKAMAQIESRV